MANALPPLPLSATAAAWDYSFDEDDEDEAEEGNDDDDDDGDDSGEDSGGEGGGGGGERSWVCRKLARLPCYRAIGGRRGAVRVGTYLRSDLEASAVAAMGAVAVAAFRASEAAELSFHHGNGSSGGGGGGGGGGGAVRGGRCFAGRPFGALATYKKSSKSSKSAKSSSSAASLAGGSSGGRRWARRCRGTGGRTSLPYRR